MIESIEFSNFKALRKTTLPLSPFTLLLGPNGSGKTTVLQALQRIASLSSHQGDGHGGLTLDEGSWSGLISVTVDQPDAPVEVKLRLRLKNLESLATIRWLPNGVVTRNFVDSHGASP